MRRRCLNLFRKQVLGDWYLVVIQLLDYMSLCVAACIVASRCGTTAYKRNSFIFCVTGIHCTSALIFARARRAQSTYAERTCFAVTSDDLLYLLCRREQSVYEVTHMIRRWIVTVNYIFMREAARAHDFS